MNTIYLKSPRSKNHACDGQRIFEFYQYKENIYLLHISLFFFSQRRDKNVEQEKFRQMGLHRVEVSYKYLALFKNNLKR